MLVHEKTKNLSSNMGYLPRWESMWYERDGIEETLFVKFGKILKIFGVSKSVKKCRATVCGKNRIF